MILVITKHNRLSLILLTPRGIHLGEMKIVVLEMLRQSLIESRPHRDDTDDDDINTKI